jgi:hypothetical protein
MSNNAIQLLKILMGAAWLDGKVQPEEQERLHQIAQQKGLLDNAELHPWKNAIVGLMSIWVHTLH